MFSSKSKIEPASENLAIQASRRSIDLNGGDHGGNDGLAGASSHKGRKRHSWFFNYFKRSKSKNDAESNTFKSDLNIATIGRLKMVASAARRATLRRQTTARGVLLPDKMFRVFWDFVNVIMLAYTVFEIPYTMVFLTDDGDCSWSPHAIVNLGIDIFFLIDICLTFNTAFIDEFGALVTDHKTIAFTYFKGWFFPDLISSVPLGSIMCLAGVGQNKLFRFLKAFRLLKLARLFKILRLLKKWDTLAGSSSVTNILNLCKFVAVMIFVAHIFGCFWMVLLDVGDCYISMEDFEAQDSISMKCDCVGEEWVDCVKWNWLVRYDPTLSMDSGKPESKYLASIYFTVVTLSTVGYGDITPVNDTERMYAVLLALVGALVFAFCIGSISSLASQGNITEQMITESMHGITDFLRYKNIPRHLQAKVRTNVFHATRKAPHMVHQCLAILPRVIKNEIMIYLTADETEGIPFFQDLDIDCRARITALLRPCTFKPREYVYHALDAGTEMYFIVKGEVEIINIEEGKVIGKCKAGEMLGEACMFPELIPFRYHSVKARSQVELLELQRDDMHAVIKPLFPDVYQTIKDTAMEKISNENADRLLQKMGERAAQRCATLERDGANYRDTQRKLKRAKGTMMSATLFLGGRAKTKESIHVPATPPALFQTMGANILTPARPRQLPGTGGYASGGGTNAGTASGSTSGTSSLGRASSGGETNPEVKRPTKVAADSLRPENRYERERDSQILQHNAAVQEQLNNIAQALQHVQQTVDSSRVDTESRIVEMEKKMDDCLAMVDQLHTWRDHDVNLQMYRHVGVPGWDQPWHFTAGMQSHISSRRSSLRSLTGEDQGERTRGSSIRRDAAAELVRGSSRHMDDIMDGEVRSSFTRHLPAADGSRKQVMVTVPEPPAESDEETPVDGPLTNEKKKAKNSSADGNNSAGAKISETQENGSSQKVATNLDQNSAVVSPQHLSSNASSIREELVGDLVETASPQNNTAGLPGVLGNDSQSEPEPAASSQAAASTSTGQIAVPTAAAETKSGDHDATDGDSMSMSRRSQPPKYLKPLPFTKKMEKKDMPDAEKGEKSPQRPDATNNSKIPSGDL